MTNVLGIKWTPRDTKALVMIILVAVLLVVYDSIPLSERGRPRQPYGSLAAPDASTRKFKFETLKNQPLPKRAPAAPARQTPQTPLRDSPSVEQPAGLSATEHVSRAAAPARGGALTGGTVPRGEPSHGGLPESRQVCTPKSKNCLTTNLSKINQNSILPLKDAHKGHTGVLFCTGPSLDNYTHSELDSHGRQVITAGVNSIIYSNIPIDYLFVSSAGKPKSKHASGYLANRKAMNDFRCRRRKFFGYFRQAPGFGPDDKAVAEAGAQRFEADAPACGKAPLPLVKDVGHYQLGSSCSTALIALQVLLYTGVEQVLVVGCDVDGGGYSARLRGAPEAPAGPQHVGETLQAWAAARAFLQEEYPAVRARLVNPAGLRGTGWQEIHGPIDW